EGIHAIGIESDEPSAVPEHTFDLTGQPPWIGKMVNQATQQHSVEARAFEWQIFRIAFDQFEARIFATAKCHQFGADIEAYALIHPLAPQLWKRSPAGLQTR